MAGLYIHIPFCKTRCIYCDFYSNTCMDYKEAFLTALLREMEIRRDEWRGIVFNTIYFGGGTPSQLHIDDLKRLFEGVYRFFSISANPEITIEANPDDLSLRYLVFIKMLSINRISIGIQSFDDRELRLLNRRHTAQEAIEAVKRCKEVDLNNISIDLMYALPGQTDEQWSQTVDKAIALKVYHISAYSLSYEPGTVLYQMMKNKEITPVNDDDCERFYHILTAKLAAANFVHYEISNFTRRTPLYPSGRISLHNSSYWNGTHYLGLGPSAHSYNGNSRSWNVSSLTDYISALRDHTGIFYETERLSERDKYNDFIITRLRTMWGISSDELRREFGKLRESDFLKKCEHWISIKKLKKQDGNVKLLPEDFFISDAIMRELID